MSSSTPPTSPIPEGASLFTPTTSPSPSPKRKRDEEEIETEQQPPTKVAKTASIEPESPKRKRDEEEIETEQPAKKARVEDEAPAKESTSTLLPPSPKRKRDSEEEEDDLRSLFEETEDENTASKRIEEPPAKKAKKGSIPESERPVWWESDDDEDLKRQALAKEKRKKRMKNRVKKKAKKAKKAANPEWYGQSDSEDNNSNERKTSHSSTMYEKEEEEEYYEDPYRLLLYDDGCGEHYQKKNQVSRGHVNFFHKNHGAVAAPRRSHNNQQDEDAVQYDSDYNDVDYDYARDPDDDDDVKKLIDPEEYDPDFETKEISSKGKIKIPDYKLKDMENEEITIEEDEAKKAWKILNGLKAEEVIEGLATEEYVEWKKQCEEFFSEDAKKKNKELFGEDPDFPTIESEECGFGFRDCVKGEKLGICQHDILRVLKGSGVLIEGEVWIERLKKERMRWHPDKFARKMEGQFEDEGKEMFQIIQALVEKEEREQ